jgi:hypothetical protein
VLLPAIDSADYPFLDKDKHLAIEGKKRKMVTKYIPKLVVSRNLLPSQQYFQ